MAKKKNEFWENSKLDLIPVFICARKAAEKAAAARAALDSANMAKDTVVLSAVKNNQK